MITPDSEKTKEELLREVCVLRGRVEQLEAPDRATAAVPVTDWVDDLFHSLVDGIEDYAIFMLDPNGRVITWNSGAERLWGYTAEEILGRHFSCFYTDPEIASGKPSDDLERARAEGKHVGEGPRVRKDGSHFRARAVMTALRDSQNELYGFARIVHDVSKQEQAQREIERLNCDLERRVLERTGELAAANEELAAFSYSVSHDLRTPLRAIDGFSQAVLEDYAPALDSTGVDYLMRIRSEAQRMGELIDGLLDLARITRAELSHRDVNLSEIVHQVAHRLRQSDPHRQAEFVITKGAIACGDGRMLRILLANLLENAWKFTSTRTQTRIEFGMDTQPEDATTWWVRDNGVGFDMAYSRLLFGAFQRLHAESEFPGTGIGLATVQRIINRHGGRVWAEAALDQGATFYFTL